MNDLPPSAFSNAVNSAHPKFNFQNWRQSPEWKIWVAGRNDGMNHIIREAHSQTNYGRTHDMLFGEEKPK